MKKLGCLNKASAVALLTRYIPEEYMRETKQFFSTNALAEFWGVPVSSMRTALIMRGISLKNSKLATTETAQKMALAAKSRIRGPMSKETRLKMSRAKTGKGRGFSIKKSGYVEITMGSSKFRSVHVVKMEAVIGRRLRENECVHHIDGNRSNNDLTNLAFMTKAAHSRLHRLQDQMIGKNRKRNQKGRFL